VVNEHSLRRLTEIAEAAGAAAMSHYGSDGEVRLKEDRSPVTAADRAAHRTIVDALGSWNAAIPVVSEEGRIPPYEERAPWDRLWLVDPLDGTKEFLSRNGEFTINIALIESGQPVLGVVFAPAIGVLYTGGRDLGAWKRVDSSPPQRVFSAPARPGTRLVVAESRSHPSPELEAYLTSIPVKERIQMGSSLKFCLVAEGTADLYPRFGPTMEWDTAAGDCIFRHSGRDGERRSALHYNTPSLRHERFIIGE
jgi:3'(2'), 5'-bisphosphate nucleotidase